MSVGTTRLNLTKPGGGLTGLITPPDPVDIDVINANSDKIDDAIGFKVVTSGTRPASPFDGQPIFETDTLKILVWRQVTTTWQDQGIYLGAGRGALANWLVTTPAALDALTTATIGDTAWMTTPGASIDPFMWVASAGAGVTIDWRPAETIIAASKGSMDTFITDIAALSDLRFHISADWFDRSTLLRYVFTTAVGLYRRFTGSVVLVPTIVGTGGTSAVDVQTGEITFSGAITRLDAYIPTAQIAYLTNAKFVDLSIGYTGTTQGTQLLSLLTGAGAVDANNVYYADYSANAAGVAIPESRAVFTSWQNISLAIRKRRRIVLRVFNLAEQLPTECVGTFKEDDTGGVNRVNGSLELTHEGTTVFGGFRLALSGMGTISNGQLAMEVHY